MSNEYDVMNEFYYGAAIKKAKAYTDSEVSKVRNKFQVVASYEDLPAVGDANTIYLVPTGSDNIYEQYVYDADTSSYVDIGDTTIDLDEYTTDEELNTRLAPIEEITQSFTIEDGKLCYVPSAEEIQGGDDGEDKPVALNETLQDLVDAVEEISNKVSSSVEATIREVVAEDVPSILAEELPDIVDDELGDVVEQKLPAEVASQISAPTTQAVNAYCAANFSEWSGALDNTLTDSSMAAPADKVGEIKSALTQLDKLVKMNSVFDGTKATYDRVMKNWFNLHDAENCTPTQLTALCEEWYTISQRSWDGYVTFAEPTAQGASQSSNGTRGGDNVNMICTPSTDAVAGQDDYAGHPLFACTDVNFTVDATSLDVVITAIDGITSGFERNNPNKYVGVMQMAGWRYEYEDATSYTEGYRDSFLATYEHIAPLPEAVRVDGTVRKFVVHAKYMSGVVDTKMTSCAGVMTQNFISHNTLHTFSNKNGAQYSGSTTADLAFLKLMTRIKYASLTLDGIMNGCLDYNLQYYAQVAETGVKRIILAANTNLLVGSTIIIGTYNGSSADRGTAANYSISGQRGVVITAIEEVVINETTYKAVTVDIANSFDTSANGSATAGTTIVSTLHWKTGSCDGVLGNDGSPVSNTDSKHPRKLQGIEFTVGGYEVLADVIMSEELIETNSHYVPAIVKRSANQATSITANYTKIYDLAIANPASAGWQYIKKEKYANGMYYPAVIGGSSSSFTRDAFYMDKNSTTGTREYLAFGLLVIGLAVGGLSYLGGSAGLSAAYWNSLARLSPNGNRGEWSA